MSDGSRDGKESRVEDQGETPRLHCGADTASLPYCLNNEASLLFL